MKILFIGDIVGKSGRSVLSRQLGRILQDLNIELCIANCENAAGGFGLTAEVGQEILASGVDVMTSGNHIWDKREVFDYIRDEPRLLRPANYVNDLPGRGTMTVTLPSGVDVTIANISGRAFLDCIDCPFQAMDRIIGSLRRQPQICLVDFHAEATAEKLAMGWYVDGRISALVGTHTHVQTADERVLPQGTAYITDVGMTGAFDGVIGFRPEDSIYRFKTGISRPLQVAKENKGINAVVISIDEKTGKAISIERLSTLK
ncbi:MAG: TIGR00282 family metallophosphoesterase [Candidatus Coatesbacteria bacterium]|nr:TIGR00282 family metallophosphoesterase [Candidatus Coatesbacteria bacterium]